MGGTEYLYCSINVKKFQNTDVESFWKSLYYFKDISFTWEFFIWTNGGWADKLSFWTCIWKKDYHSLISIFHQKLELSTQQEFHTWECFSKQQLSKGQLKNQTFMIIFAFYSFKSRFYSNWTTNNDLTMINHCTYLSESSPNSWFQVGHPSLQRLRCSGYEINTAVIMQMTIMLANEQKYQYSYY